MKQLVQSPKSGKLEQVEVPTPAVGAGQVLIRNHFSVMSPGTEKMAMEFARKSMLGKARSRPDLVQQVMRKMKQDGPLPTYQAAMNRLDSPQVLGYSCAGIVEEVGDGVTGFAQGDRVAAAGAGYANHAEWVAVPENLVARASEGLSLDRAAFATLGAISLQGLRVGDPTLGEIVAVVGLGLIGQLVVQLLHANGCRVLGVDLDPTRVKQSLDLGAEWGAAPGDDHDTWKQVAASGHGVDLAVVTAASDSSAPIQLAADLCRAGGRIAVVGATAMDLDRRSFYEKELELRMSMSYGPGRYDRRYEELGLDYPISQVRWTENRNLQAFLALATSGAVDPLRLDVDTVPFEEARASYEALARGERSHLCVIFSYDAKRPAQRSLEMKAGRAPRSGDVGIGFVGAGNYAKAVMLPILGKARGVVRRSVVTATGPSAKRTAERFGFAHCGTDPNEVFADEATDLVFITTRHDSHAALAEQALRAGKGVWLEKPVGLTMHEVESVERAVRDTGGFLMVGYNRRFSSHARAVREAFAARSGAMAIQYIVSAGPTPAGTWLVDPKVGGGRIIGEACHFIDLCGYLVGQRPSGVQARALGRDPETGDGVMALISYPDGSTASISYLANAGSELPKERWEVHADGKSAVCDNFRTTTLPGGKRLRGVNQDKGQETALLETLSAMREGRASPILLAEIVSTSETSLQMAGLRTPDEQ